MPIINFAGGGKGKTANKGSCSELMAYLLHEQEERRQYGQIQLFDAKSCLFDATTDQLPLEDAINKIDFNRKGLKKTDAKFYYTDINFSEGELASMLAGCQTDAEKEDVVRRFVRDTFIPMYAANFVGYKDKKGDTVEFKADDIVWAAAIHSRRLDRHGNLKEGPGWHAHVVISRRNQGMTRSISPTRNERQEHRGSCQGGFDRNEFRRKIEKAIEEKYSYNRPIADSMELRVDIPHMSFEDLKTQVNALMMYGLQLQMEAEEKRKAKEKAALEAAEAKRKAEEQARREAERAAKEAEEKAKAEAAKKKAEEEKAAKETAEAKRKAEEAAAKKAAKPRRQKRTKEEIEAMEKRPIEKSFKTWRRAYGDRRGFVAFVQGVEDNEDKFLTFGRQAEFTKSYTDTPVEEFEHSSGKIIKSLCLSITKWQEVIAEFKKKGIMFFNLDVLGMGLDKEEEERLLESKEKTSKKQNKNTQRQVQQAKPEKAVQQQPKADTTSTKPNSSLPRKNKSETEIAYDVWSKTHGNDEPDKPRVIFVYRDGPYGKFFQTYKEDAFLAGWTKDLQAKMDKGSLSGVEVWNVANAENLRKIFTQLDKQGFDCEIVDTQGKKVFLPAPTKNNEVPGPQPKVQGVKPVELKQNSKKEPAQEQKNTQEQKAENKQEQHKQYTPNEVFDVWKKASTEGKTTIVQRQNNKGDNFYTVFNKDAEKIASLLGKTTKDANLKDEPNAKYLVINQDAAQKVLKEIGQINAVDMVGRFASIMSAAKTKQKTIDYSKYKMPEGKKVDEVRVRFNTNENKWYLAATVNGYSLREITILQEDVVNFKHGQATRDNIVAKYYSPEAMEPKREQSQNRGMGR